VPFLPESDLSIFNIFQFETLNSFVQYETNDNADGNVEKDGELQELYRNQEVNNSPNIDPKELNSNLEYNNGINNETEKNNMGVIIFKIIFLIWAIGFATMVTYIIISISKMKAKEKLFKIVEDKRLTCLMDEFRRKIGVEKQISIYAGNNLKSPCIAGVINPCIYFPKSLIENISEDELAHMLLHELAHFKRKDQIWNIISIAALSVHWFNPLVWVSINKMKIDRELACDAYVLEIIGEEQAVSYGMTIIEMLKYYSLAQSAPNLLYFLHFNEHKNNLEKRIKMIKNFKKGSYKKISVVAAVCYGLIGMIALTNASEVTRSIPQDIISNNAVIEKSADEIIDHSNQTKEAETVATASDAELIVSEDSIVLKDIFDNDSRVYSDINSVLTELKYKAPDYIPESYGFSTAKVRVKEKMVDISYKSRQSIINIELRAIPEAAEDKDLFVKLSEGKTVDLNEEGSNNKYKQGESLVIESQNVLKISTMYGPENNEKVNKIEYVWENEGVQYTLSQYTSLSSNPFSGEPFSDKEMLKIVAAMKHADEITNVNYKNSSISSRIYDTGDLHKAIKILGFVPKFSLQPVEGYHAKLADVSTKSNIIYNANTPCLRTVYIQLGERKDDLCEFELLKDKNIYESIKNNGYFEANMISGSHDTIKVGQMNIRGKEVYKTAIYQKYENEIDDDETYSAITYFWEENNYFCNATLYADTENQEQIVHALINQGPVDINNIQ
jgi:bla regulator protein BlaR1